MLPQVKSCRSNQTTRRCCLQMFVWTTMVSGNTDSLNYADNDGTRTSVNIKVGGYIQALTVHSELLDDVFWTAAIMTVNLLTQNQDHLATQTVIHVEGFLPIIILFPVTGVRAHNTPRHHFRHILSPFTFFLKSECDIWFQACLQYSCRPVMTPLCDVRVAPISFDWLPLDGAVDTYNKKHKSHVDNSRTEMTLRYRLRWVISHLWHWSIILSIMIINVINKAPFSI